MIDKDLRIWQDYPSSSATIIQLYANQSGCLEMQGHVVPVVCAKTLGTIQKTVAAVASYAPTPVVEATV